MKKWIIVGVILAIGVLGSVRDYRQWWHEEWDRYGHGWEENVELAKAGKLVGPYENKKLGLRLNYPQDWDVVERDGGVSFVHPFAMDREGLRPTIVVTMGNKDRNLSDLADAQAAGLTAAGKVLHDREYVNNQTINLVVLSWEEGKNVYQKVIGEKNGRVITIDTVCDAVSWKVYANTVRAVYASVVVF